MNSIENIHYGVPSVTDIIKPTRILVTFIGGIVIVDCYLKKYKDNFYTIIILHLLIIFSINGVMMILQSFSTEFNSAVNEFRYRSEDALNRVGLEFRSSGLFLSGGALPSAFQSFSILFIPYLLYMRRINIVTSVILFVILILSTITSGRTGLITIFPTIYLFLLYAYWGNKGSQYILIILICMLLAEPIAFELIENLDYENLQYNIERLKRLDENTSQSGVYSNSTIDIIINKLSLPDKLSILLFGTLGFHKSYYSNVSDMGFNINLWRYGLFGCILYYRMLYIACRVVIKNKIPNIHIKSLISLFLLVYIVFELKENAMFARNSMSVFSLLLASFELSFIKRNPYS